MGQYTSFLPRRNHDSNRSTTPNPSSTSASINTTFAPSNNNNQQNRRRRSSTYTTSLLPPSRRRRLLFWNRNDGHPTEISSTVFQSGVNPIQEAIEGSSGSGNIISDPSRRPLLNTFTEELDELNDIASDLLSAVSRDQPARGSHNYSSLSSLASSQAPIITNTTNTTPTSTNTPSNNTPSSDLGLTFEHQTEMLARLLEVGSTSTILTLMGASVPTGRRFDNVSRTSGSNNDGLGNDTNFEEFVQGLRNGLLTNELSRSNENNENMTFFRAFRFDNPEQQNENSNVDNSSDIEQNGEQLNDLQGSFDSTPVDGSSRTNTNTQPAQDRMVPVVIVGVRSVQQGPEIGDIFSNSVDEEINLTMNRNGLSQSRNTTGSDNVLDNQAESINSSNISLNEPNLLQQQQQQRTWIIFLMGNSFNSDHPLLSAPSLMSENPTYEDLLNLQELIGQVKPSVTTNEELTKHEDQLYELKLKDFEFKMQTEYKVLETVKEDRCQICLCEYENNEVVRKLNGCKHFYHKGCIDNWLVNGKDNCPLCRTKWVVEEDNEI